MFATDAPRADFTFVDFTRLVNFDLPLLALTIMFQSNCLQGAWRQQTTI